MPRPRQCRRGWFGPAIAGASAGLSIYEVVNATGDIGQILFLIVLAMTFLIAIPAGLGAAWLQQGCLRRAAHVLLRGGRVHDVRRPGGRRGCRRGRGGLIVAEHPRKPRADGSRAAGLFVLFSNGQTASQVADK
jgi:hypothetical protein